MAFCPQCGKSVGFQDSFCPSCGYDLSAKPETATSGAAASTGPLDSVARQLIRTETSLLKRVPVFSTLDYWLFIAGLFFLYAGTSEIVLRYGPGLAFAIGAIVVALIYIYMGRTYHLRKGAGWILQASVGLPVLVIIGDIIVTGIFTSLSALLVMINLVILYVALKELREAEPPEK